MAKTTAAGERPARTPRAAQADTPAAKPARTRGAPAPADPPAVKEAALSPRARKAAAEKKATPAKQPAATRAGSARRGFEPRVKGPDLREDLRAFVTARPGGWGHEDWVTFLDHLAGRGHDVSNADSIGLQLERERLAAALEGVQGMGPRRIDAVVQRYDTLWSARNAGVDEIAALPGLNRSLAEKVRQALH